MVQLLRVLVALLEDSSLVPSVHMGTGHSSCLLLASASTFTHTPYIIKMHRIKNNKMSFQNDRLPEMLWCEIKVI